jgi:hypothetical protein
MRDMGTECCIALMATGEATRHSAKEVCKSHCANPGTGRILPYRLHWRILLSNQPPHCLLWGDARAKTEGDTAQERSMGNVMAR